MWRCKLQIARLPTMKSQGSAKNEANNVAQTAAAAPAETAKVDFSNVKVEPLFEEEVDFDTFSPFSRP